jgi:hypothetical protein
MVQREANNLQFNTKIKMKIGYNHNTCCSAKDTINPGVYSNFKYVSHKAKISQSIFQIVQCF